MKRSSPLPRLVFNHYDEGPYFLFGLNFSPECGRWPSVEFVLWFGLHTWVLNLFWPERSRP